MVTKKAQEEMVGFAFIIIIVAVIMVIFIGLSLNKPSEESNSYEVESFITALLQSTSDCEDRFEFISIQKLISRCNTNSNCIDGKSACEVLNSSVKDLLGIVWKIKDRPIKGYEFRIVSAEEEMIFVFEGNKSNNYKGAVQNLPNDLGVSFKAYY